MLSQATCVVAFGGANASKKAQVIADATLKRTRRIFSKLKIPDFEKTYVQILGSEQSFGKNAISEDKFPREAEAPHFTPALTRPAIGGRWQLVSCRLGDSCGDVAL